MAGSLGGEVGLQTAAKVFALDWRGLAFTLTLNGSLNAETQSLWLSDIAHHHVAIGVLALIAGHLYRTQFGLGVPIATILASQASQVIQGYGSSNGAYSLMFLGAHFVWAFSLMFLFSGRGYWQELIESIVWAHQTIGCAPSIFPRALSITQGRCVGVVHARRPGCWSVGNR